VTHRTQSFLTQTCRQACSRPIALLEYTHIHGEQLRRRRTDVHVHQVLERPGDDLGLDAAVGRGHGRGRGRRAAVRAPEHLALERAARGHDRAGMRGQRGEAERRPGGVVVDEVHAEPAFTGNNRGRAGAASLPGEEEGEQKKHRRRFHGVLLAHY